MVLPCFPTRRPSGSALNPIADTMKPSRNRRQQLEPTSRRVSMGTKFTPTRLRIVAGDLRGRKVDYNGDPATRPMKQRTREAVFSLLGGHLPGTQAIDLFGGTGILAFESVSRGSVRASILELARPAVKTMLENLRKLDLAERVQVHNVDTLRWLRSVEGHVQGWQDLPWIVFCCPPYRLWHTQGQRLADGLASMFELSPVGSRFVCETEDTFDIAAAIPQLEWDVRKYSPARIAIAEKPESVERTEQV